MLGHPRRETELGVAIVGSGVDVVDPEFEQRRQQLVGTFLPHPAEGGCPEDDATAFVAGTAEGCGLDALR